MSTTMSREIEMDRGRTLKPGRYIAILFAGGLLFLCLFGQRLTVADDTLNVKRDSDKTVYTIGATDEKNYVLDGKHDKEKNVYSIGSSKEKRNQEALKEEKSWDMLMNSDIIMDNRHGKHGQGQNPEQVEKR
jgi:hypothetical protein